MFVFSLFLFGCNSGQGLKNKEDEYGFLVAEAGEVTLPLTPFDSLDPLITSNMSYFYLNGLVYDGIYTLDKNYRPILQLGESENVQGKSITIKLKDGITFHDGSELTSKEVVDSFNHIKISGVGAYSDLVRNPFDNTSSLNAEVVDRDTVKFTWNGPGPMLKEYLIFPIAKYTSDRNVMPQGTGPFKFDKYETKKAIYLLRYEYYYDQMPSITKVTGIVHEDEDLIFTSLETGRINVSTAWNNEYGRFYNNDKFSANIFPGNKLTFLFLNPSGVLGDDNLRRGIYYSIDKDALIKGAVKDRGVKTSSFMNPKSYYAKSINDMHDINKAREFLAGKNLKIRILCYWNDKEHLEVANYLTSIFKNVGVDATIVGAENKDFDMYKDRLLKGDYDIAVSEMNSNIIPTYPLFLNNGGVFPYSDEGLNKIVLKYKSAFNNRDVLNINQEADDYIYQKMVFLPLYFNENAMIYSKQIMGESESNNIFPYKTLKKAYFTEKQEGKDLDESSDEKDEK